MDETLLLSMIAEGETRRVDFKRVLDLSSARAKAEFIKDVIAIANSSSEGGYLLIGIQDDKHVVGIHGLEEEQIQHIVHVYIDPAVLIKCDVVPIAATGFLKVGVIHIQATKRPLKVVKPIDFLNKDDVFIRRGTVIFKASPEEIIQMNSAITEIERKIAQYAKATDTHLRLSNYQSAIRSLSEAIELAPSAELFLKRAQIRIQLETKSWSSDNREALTKDLSDAITLTDSFELEQSARLLRLHNGVGEDQDFEWLKFSYEGMERAKFIIDYMRFTEGNFIGTDPQGALKELQEALELGFQEPEIFLYLADAHHCMQNFGLALAAIDKGLAQSPNNQLKLGLLREKWDVLCRLGHILEAREIYLQAKSINEDSYFSIWPFSEHELIYALALKHELGETLTSDEDIILKILTLHLARSLVREVDNNWKTIGFSTRLDDFSTHYPRITDLLRELIGDELWQKVLDDLPITVSINFPTIAEQISQSKQSK